jgi:two-component system sensor histidine kinase DesK
VSRDLHDSLGQSLAAVSLKGDLALALIRSDSPRAAEDEIRSLTATAREALRDVQHVVRNTRPVSLVDEVEGATRLLTAAGIDASSELLVDDLPPAVDELLGWAVREGATNALRHSNASRSSIRATHENGTVLLEISNDGASRNRPSAGGTGISGLHDRARMLGGSVTAGEDAGRFRLRVEVPEDPR